MPVAAVAPASDHAFFGHPIGLATLFFTEMWERFSYYGMRAFLIIYLTAPVSVGGKGMLDAPAGSGWGEGVRSPPGRVGVSFFSVRLSPSCPPPGAGSPTASSASARPCSSV